MMNRYTRSIKYISKVKSLINVLVKGLFGTVNLGSAAKSVISASLSDRFIRNSKKSTVLFATCLLMLLGAGNVNAAARFAVTSGSWTGAIWATTAGGTAGTAATPVAGDAVTINSGVVVNVTAAGAVCASIAVTAPTVNNGITITSPGVLTVSGAITMNAPTAGTITSTIAVGSGTLAAASIAIPGSGTAGRNCILSISSGIVTTTGNISFSGTAAQAQLTFTGAGTLNVAGTLGTGGTFTPLTGTVNCNGAAQTIAPYTYNNLTLSGSGTKTFASTPTVNGILSMEGTAAVLVTVGVVTYGANATLQYNKPGAYTATSEEWITPFAGAGGVVITNVGAITMNTAKVFNANIPLAINSGATLTPGANLLTLGGDFVNNGTFTSGSGGVTIAGTDPIQSISGFTTTGLVSMTKTAGIATLQGNVNGAGLTINGAGGTLNLGSGLTHTFTGVVTLTAGSLNGGSSTLNENATSATAWNGTGTVFTPGTGTVNFGGVAQTLATASIFNNLTFSNSGLKTLTGLPTVNGVLSMEGTATASVAPTYGSGATLQYNTSSARTAGVEWVSPFTASGGIIIRNTGAITMNSAEVMDCGDPLTISSGATLKTNNFQLTLGGNFVNDGTFTAGSSNIFVNCAANQSIDGFTTTGTVSMTKTGGIATLQGNVNGGGLTINGAGGTLNLGAGLTHTFTGVVTLTAGTLNGGSSTLNENATSATAWNGTGTVFTPGTGTVNFGGAAQTLSASSTTFNNLTLGGSGTKTFGSTTVTNGVFTINSGVVANLGAFTHSANTLSLAGSGQPAGSWGGTGSAATFKNSTYFAPVVTGVLNVAAKSCTAGSWTGLISTDWNTANNWCDGTVPTASTNVIIPSGGNQPVIGAAGGLCNNITVNSGASLTITGSNTLTISGDWVNNGTFTPNTSTVTYNGAAQTIAGVNYYNLTLSGSGTKTLQATTTAIGGNFTLTGNGTTTTAVTGLTIGGNVYLESNTFFTSGAFIHNVGGDWTNNGWGATFTPGTGTVNFTGNNSVINGTNATQNFNNIIVSKTAGQTVSFGGSSTTLTVGGTFSETTGNFTAPANMTVTGDLTLTSGTFSAGASLIESGNWTNNGATFTPGAGTVTMNGSGKVIGGSVSNQFNGLTIGNGSDISLGTDQTVNGTLTLLNGLLKLGNFNLTLGASSPAVAGSFYGSSMIVADGSGQLRKIFNHNDFYFFPIGDSSSNYSPIKLDFASGTYAGGAYAGVTVTNAKHPSNSSVSNYLTRYWNVSQSGISSFSCTVTGNYIYGDDVVGQEGLQSVAEYTGSLPWVTYPVSLGSSTLSVAGVNTFGAFTGIETINITTSTISPSSFCPGSAVSVPFVIKGTYTAGNVFTAQLSDASGSFASPVNIGTLTATTSGTISATIPAGAVAGSGYRIRVVSNTPVITGTDNGANLTINTNSTAPTTTGGFICIGSTATLAASGAVTNEKYVWYNVATGGTALKTSTDNNDNTYTTAVLAATTNYWVSIMNAGGCEGPRTQVIATFPSVCTDPLTPGVDSWIGYIYGGRDTNFANNIYYGHYTEPETFNEGFGGDATCFGLTSNSTSISIYTQNLSAKYLMNSTKKGLYVVDLGSDDGNRLTVDGTLLYNDWGDHALSSHPRVLMNLKGTSSLMYEYYENGGGNTVYFQNLTQVLGNTLTTNTTQTVLLGNTGAAISGDAYGTLPTGVSLSGTGYQWTYSTTPGGARTTIAGATGATFTPSNAIAPFNTAGTYYVYRNAILSSTNNFGASPYVATNESNVATITIAAPGVSSSVSSLTGFSYVVGSGPSGEQSFNVVGIGLIGNITVTPPADFEVSVLSGGVFQTTPLTLTALGGVVNTTVYVRMKQGLTVGGYNSENIVLSSPGFTSKNVACSGIVIPGVTAGGGGSYCATNTITLTSSPNPPNITLTNVYWTGPNGFYSVLQNPTITNATTAMAGTYTVTGNYVPSGNLVANGSFESGNTGFTTSYTLSSGGTNGLYNPGVYAVIAVPHDQHPNFCTTGDHTTGTGLQFVANGAATPQKIWEPTALITVTPNTNYQFTYWVRTVDSGDASPSQTQLFINGTAAGPINIASTTQGLWTQFVYNWNSGSSTTADLILMSENSVGAGNDFAIDDIVFQPVYTSTASVNVSVLATSSPASVTIAASPGSSVNSGTSVTFTATPTSGGTAPTYQWQVNGANVGTNSPTYTYIPTDGNTITCTMTSNSGCIVGSPTVTSNTITMAVNNPPNYWKGAYSTDWGTASNWTAGYVPGIGDNIIFSTVSTSGDALNNLVLDKDRTIGNLTNLSSKKLIIPPAKCLTANGTITTDGNSNKIYIQAWPDGTQQNGSLIFHNDVSAPVYASVEMYSKATRDPSGVFDPVTNQTYHYSWQYFGIPLRSVVADPTFYGSFVRRNDEASTNTLGKWISLANSDVLTSFTGYEITQDVPATFVFQGALENGDKSIALPYTSTAYDPGQTILANPYTAAIDVRQLTFGANTEKTVYLYNTGSFGQWAVNNGETKNDTTTTIPGQYIAIPQRVAASIGLPNDIPSMSGFLVKAMGAGGGSLTIGYNSVITKNVNPQRAPQLAQASGQVYMEITLKGKNYGDRVWLVDEPGTSHDFDNGWDGYKLFGAVGTPKLFAMEKDANYQISTTDDMNNTYLGFQAGVDLEDTLTFRSANVATRYSGIYLVDLVENKVIDITKPGTQYTFKAATTTAPIKRFKVVTQPIDSIPANSAPQLKVFNDNNIVFVDNPSSQKGDLYFYDIMGRFLKKETFGPNGISAFPLFSVTGAYIVKTVTSTEEVSKKIIIK